MKKEDFEKIVKDKLRFEDEIVLNDFIDYWTGIPINGKKMLFEHEKKFVVERRFNTWKQNNKKFKKVGVIEGTILAYEQSLKKIQNEYGVNEQSELNF